METSLSDVLFLLASLSSGNEAEGGVAYTAAHLWRRVSCDSGCSRSHSEK